MSTSRILKTLKCSSEDKIRCIETLLDQEACTWWEFKSSKVEPENQTWEFFEEEFNQEYTGEIYQERMRDEFIALKQGKMSVDAYYAEFKRLSKYAKAMVATDKDRCVQFLSGLNKKIHHMVTMNRGNSFGDMVANAKKAEESLARPSESEDEDDRAKSAGKRTASQSKGPSKSFKGTKHSTPSYSRGGKSKGWSKQSSVFVGSVGSNPKSSLPKCNLCHKYHPGECQRGAGACFRCGSKNHFV